MTAAEWVTALPGIAALLAVGQQLWRDRARTDADARRVTLEEAVADESAMATANAVLVASLKSMGEQIEERDRDVADLRADLVEQRRYTLRLERALRTANIPIPD